MNVVAAIKKLEKIEIIRQSSGIYKLNHAVTASQKEILKAFNLPTTIIHEKISLANEELSLLTKEM